MQSLDNYTTQATYTDQGSVLTPVPVAAVTIIVTNAPIFAQFMVTNPNDPRPSRAEDWDPADRRMPVAGVYQWEAGKDFNGAKILGVRVKSAVAATPATVTIHA